MNLITSLAQSPDIHSWLKYPSYLPNGTDVMNWCRNMDAGTAALFIILGLVLLLWGYNLHRGLIAFTFAILGAYLGAGLAERFNLMPLIGVVAGAVILGSIAWMWTNWVAAVIGAICGALLGSAIWQMAGLNPDFAWSGAMTGAVALGLLCFILFRISVILYTSLQGSVMLVFGSLGMAFQYSSAKSVVEGGISHWPFILPVTILSLVMLGLIYQHMKAPAGGGGAGGSAGGGSSKPAPAPKKEKAE